MPLTRTLTSMESSDLAKLTCTPTQHTGMLVVLSSVGGAVMLGGTSGCVVVRRESGCQQLNTEQKPIRTWDLEQG